MKAPKGLVITNIPDNREALKELLLLLENKFPDLHWSGMSREKPTAYLPGATCWGLFFYEDDIGESMSYSPDVEIVSNPSQTPMDYADVVSQLRGGYNDG